MEGDEHAAGRGKSGRRGADRARRHGFGDEAAAEAAEIAAIQKIGAPVLAEREQQRLRAVALR